MTMDNINRGPFYRILDKMALAHQAKFGGSYEQAFTKVYTAPENTAIVDGSKYDDISTAFDSVYGTAHSLPPNADVKKKAAYATLEAQARRRMATTGETFAKAYSAIYTAPENIALRNGVTDPLAKAAEVAEHLGPAHARMHSLAIDRMRATGKSYEQAYSYIYGGRENEALRSAVKAEHMRSTMAAVQG